MRPATQQILCSTRTWAAQPCSGSLARPNCGMVYVRAWLELPQQPSSASHAWLAHGMTSGRYGTPTLMADILTLPSGLHLSSWAGNLIESRRPAIAHATRRRYAFVVSRPASSFMRGVAYRLGALRMLHRTWQGQSMPPAFMLKRELTAAVASPTLGSAVLGLIEGTLPSIAGRSRALTFPDTAACRLREMTVPPASAKRV
ncbi:hypothetical protein BC834DRAFT_203912 [Gloeopeniophorella convolvens]|nr:hypothetical protein BC834DRAFT_203912 [Gloeopeniophorella convolvens]